MVMVKKYNRYSLTYIRTYFIIIGNFTADNTPSYGEVSEMKIDFSASAYIIILQ